MHNLCLESLEGSGQVNGVIQVLKGYAEGGALDSEHESFQGRCSQLIEVKTGNYF